MKLKSLIKIALSLIMLALVYSSVRSDALIQTITSIPPFIVVGVVLGYLAGQFLSAYKWWMITRAGGIDSTFTMALKAYFIGMFVNCFGLGVVGGDVTRGILLSTGKPHKTPAIVSVIADRLHGLVVLAMIGLIAFLVADRHVLDPSLSILLLAVIFLVIFGWITGPYILLRIVPKTSKYRRKVEQLCDVFPTKPGFLLLITAVSVLFHLTQLWLHWLMGIGIGVDIPWMTLLITIPIVNILSTLPISWNGLGVREKSYAYFLVPAVLSPEQVVAFGAIWILAVTVTSAIGGIVALITKDLDFVTKLEDSEDFKAAQEQEAL